MEGIATAWTPDDVCKLVLIVLMLGPMAVWVICTAIVMLRG